LVCPWKIDKKHCITLKQEQKELQLGNAFSISLDVHTTSNSQIFRTVLLFLCICLMYRQLFVAKTPLAEIGTWTRQRKRESPREGANPRNSKAKLAITRKKIVHRY
jgi:hypothetical protein